MDNMSDSYYKKLLGYSTTIGSSLRQKLKGIVHETFLKGPSDLNLRCYKNMYIENHGISKVLERKEVQKKIPGLTDLCETCVPFFLKKRSELNKSEDIITGVRFQEPFIDFLKSLNIDAFDASAEDMRLPDIGIKNGKGDVAILLEIKYHNAPFIKAREYVSSDTECYDGSLTIDVEKCNKQIKLAKETYPKAKNLIVHWVDFPCIKCVLWDTLETAIGTPIYDRIHRSGDYEYGRKVGYTKKIYHFVSRLNDFDSLVRKLGAGKAKRVNDS